MALDPNELDQIARIVRAEVRNELRSLLAPDLQVGPIARKFEGGKLELWPKDPNLEAKEIPIETFFNKVVMLRDRLRVLEAKINGHERLTQAEKLELQQYVTRCYGSLTTFNVLFRDKDDHFVGQSGEK